ncbi:metal dependent phosphohydrolase [Lentzea xinjiangensis]|uniref:Metal dependent phosphohydrolase n=1 Tax=Lentzea xinjiangensis TaxID=402600 RepID=A0A1H9W1N0_9PSEU|nr:HD domain-containing protein [Lentzea xinjiangensis]SES27870.1 metal dependent phosphohydrolase [Lentzea xinjiangensis]
MTRPVSRRAVLGGAAAAAGVVLGGPAAGASQADLSLPATRLARRAHELVARTHQPFLHNHSVRSFLFARAAADRQGRRPDADYDAELVFLICVLHDMGLTDEGNTDQRFEVAGADLAARFLEEQGLTDRRVDTVWEAIALHTSPQVHESPVFRRRRPAEIGIALTGIGIDVLGVGADRLPPGFADRVHARHPRLGGSRALTEAILGQALANPRKAPPMTLPGEILHQRHPSLPYRTWDMTLDASTWAD